LDDASRYGLVPTPGLRPAGVAEDVAKRLVTAIAVGTFSPGERLPSERELATRLEVSRVTVRQALQRLGELGLVVAKRGRTGGTFVTQQAWEDVAPAEARQTLETELPRLKDLFDYRCLVEGLIARTAAERRTPEQRDELTEALAAFATTGENMVLARAWDRRLHGLVCAAAHNPHLTELSAHLTAAATLGFGAEPYEPEFFAQALHEHTQLVTAVVDGDADRAQDVARGHFVLTYTTMERSLERAARR
jgi:GntR family transcriptional regulator, transcriptional repressor for pyruvate dehydrogenase complex